METFSFRPCREDDELLARRRQECNPWWVHFDEPVERVYCDREHGASVVCADYGIEWVGISTTHRPRQLRTDNPEILCFEFEIPVDDMAVEETYMKGWMEVVRQNGIHGWYRKGGTDKRYEF